MGESVRKGGRGVGEAWGAMPHRNRTIVKRLCDAASIRELYPSSLAASTLAPYSTKSEAKARSSSRTARMKMVSPKRSRASMFAPRAMRARTCVRVCVVGEGETWGKGMQERARMVNTDRGRGNQRIE